VCENGAASLLSTFSFAGLEADLERNLAFRARNSDPLGTPNYYKILYAYHVAKGDYRSGESSLMTLSPGRCGERVS
jgi:nuclear pore complex protein Nup160